MGGSPCLLVVWGCFQLKKEKAKVFFLKAEHFICSQGLLNTITSTK